MTSRAAEWRARLLLVAASLVIALLVAEAVARILLRPAAPAAGGSGTPISEPSDSLGWKPRAGGSQTIRREDFSVHLAINAMGLRGPEVPYAAPSGVRRVALMGDSFAHGYYAEEPETVRGRLGAALSGCGVDVVNGGVPGYSTDQEWLFYRDEIARYRPSEVVLLFYYNDLQFNIERVGTANRPKPVFMQNGQGLELVLPEVRTRALRREVLEARERRDRETPRARRPASTFHGSALWSFLAARLQTARPDLARSAARYGLAPEFSTLPPVEYLPFGPKDARERSLVEEMWRRTAAILTGFRDDVRDAGSGFSLMYVPARFEVNDAAWRFVQRRYEPDRPWQREAVRSRLERLLVDLDVPFVDVTPRFREAEAGALKAYLPIDGHWNARGHEIAFEGLLPSMRRAFSCEG